MNINMNNKNFHPVLEQPPLAHALHKWNEETRTLEYEYNGVNIISITVPMCDEVGFRHGSDGSMQSIQYIQQIYVSTDRPVKTQMRFLLTEDAINMRPGRAGSNEAILGQVGKPLMHGVNGLYDVTWDLLIDWHGIPWQWETSEIVTDENGMSCIDINITLSEKPLFINVRPHYYNKYLGYKYHKPWQFKPNQQAVSGWCSWEAYRRDVSIDKIKQITEFMSKNFAPYGMQYIQIDDGYQKMPLPSNPSGTMAEGWLTCEPTRFPDGHESIVATVKESGMSPGIWTNSNITNRDFLKYNGDSVIWHEDEALLGEWIDFLYNCTPETLEKHVKPLFEAFKNLGYEYIKIDAIRHLLFDGLHECVRLGIMSNDEAENRFRAYMEATREGMGEGMYYLASWGEMGEVIGLADACRLAMDANPTWAGVRMQLFESARWFFSQRILFLNDPDHVCVRTKPEWAKTVLSLISLSGQLYMLSDTPEAYTDEKTDFIKKTLPPLTTRAAETGGLDLNYPAYTWTKLHGFAVQSNEAPVSPEDVSLKDAYDMSGEFPTMNDAHPFSTLWSFHLRSSGRSWTVAARVAILPLAQTEISLSKLGLNPDKQYVAFDFWSEKGLGIVQGTIGCKPLELGSCQIISFFEYDGKPQVVASTRHVSMDAVSIKNHEFSDNTLHLKLEGVSGTTERYYVHVPENMKISAAKGTNCSASVSESAGYVPVEIRFDAEVCSVDIDFTHI